MSKYDDASNQRRAERKRTGANAVVIDVISGLPIAQLGNISSSGVLLIGTEAPRSEAIYQISVTLPGSASASQAQPIEAGIQEQWHELAASSGQVWAGYRIVAISEADASRLDSWLMQA